MKIQNIFNLAIFYVSFIFFFLLERENMGACYDKNLTNKDFYKLLASMSDNNFINANRKVVFFSIVRKKKRNYDTLMYYLYQFLLSTGVNCDIYNWNNEHFVAVTKLDNYIDRDAILDRFKGDINNVGEQMAKDVLEGIKNDILNPDL